MVLSGITSIDKWVVLLRSFPSLAIISGFTSDDTPEVETFYDFFDRVYLMDKGESKTKHKGRFTKKPNNSKKMKEDTLSEHNHKGVIQRLVDRAIREGSKKTTSPSGVQEFTHLFV